MRSETRNIALRLDAATTYEAQVRELGDVLKSVPGGCPVSVLLDMGGGNEVHLLLPDSLNVAPDDQLFTALERHFGKQVAELR